jgi:hypothetical protein
VGFWRAHGDRVRFSPSQMLNLSAREHLQLHLDVNADTRSVSKKYSFRKAARALRRFEPCIDVSISLYDCLLSESSLMPEKPLPCVFYRAARC